MTPYLDTFVAVARYGNFAITGDRLGLTASAVSMQMKRLEESLGVTLFDRSGRSVELNEMGWRVYAHAEKIIRLYQDIEQGIADDKLMDTLCVGAVQTEMMGSVVKAMPSFLHRFPQVDMKLTPGLSTVLFAEVEQRLIDCAVIVKPHYPVDNHLHWYPIRKEPYVLIAAKNLIKKDAMTMLTTHRFIRYDRRSNGGALVEQFLKNKKIVVNDAVEVDSIETIGLLVAAGVGVSIVPKSIIFQIWNIDVQEIALGVDTFYREIGLLEYANNPRSHLIKGFYEALIA